jgi:hypothetical protein
MDDSDVDETMQVTACASDRPLPKKRKMCLDGKQARGSAEFQHSDNEKLQSAWFNVQIRRPISMGILNALVI